MMDRAFLETHLASRSVQGGEELLGASSPSDSTHSILPPWRPFCSAETGTCKEVGLRE